jgi:hypothetical protein
MFRRPGFSIVLFAAVGAAHLAGSWHGAHEAVSTTGARVEPHQPVYADAGAGVAALDDPEADGTIAVSPKQR